MALGNGTTAAGIDAQQLKNILADLSAAQYLEWIDSYADADEAVKRATDRRNKLRKTIETAGIKLPALDLVRKLREMSGETRELILGQTVRMLAWEHKEPGFQASLDIANDPNMPAEVRALHAHDLKRIDDEGYKAGSTGSWKRKDNPYPPGSEAAVRWDTQWLRGDGERSGEISSTASSTTTKARKGGMAAAQRPKKTKQAAAPSGRPRGRPRKNPPAQLPIDPPQDATSH